MESCEFIYGKYAYFLISLRENTYHYDVVKYNILESNYHKCWNEYNVEKVLIQKILLI